MVVTELIEVLKEIQESHGDIEVMVHNDESDTIIEKDNIAVGRAVDTDLKTGETSEPVSVVLVG